MSKKENKPTYQQIMEAKEIFQQFGINTDNGILNLEAAAKYLEQARLKKNILDGYKERLKNNGKANHETTKKNTQR